MRKFEYVIDGNLLYVGDDCVCIDTIKKLRVETSCVGTGKHAIHIYANNQILELYYTSSDKAHMQDICDELFLAIAEAKRENNITND